MKLWPLAPILAGWIAVASGCGHESGPAPISEPTAPAATATVPSTVSSHVGEGPLPVFGASVYSPGQEIYKALRQEDSLMAFLACQGEPDRLEVRESDASGAPPRIILEYTRRSVPRGTVEIEPTTSGYYAARPIDPSGHLASSASKPGAEPPAHPSKPAPSPKPTPTPARSLAPEREPERKPTAPPEAEAPPPKPALPQPSPSQHDECPIEPWRSDCRDLCVPGASWEWCAYRD